MRRQWIFQADLPRIVRPRLGVALVFLALVEADSTSRLACEQWHHLISITVKPVIISQVNHTYQVS